VLALQPGVAQLLIDLMCGRSESIIRVDCNCFFVKFVLIDVFHGLMGNDLRDARFVGGLSALSLLFILT
jgi:hypothetical protein